MGLAGCGGSTRCWSRPSRRCSTSKPRSTGLARWSRRRRSGARPADFEACLDGFSAKVQSTLESFEFRNQIPRLSRVLTGAEETLQQLAAARGKQDPPYGKGWQGDAHFLAR